MDAFVAKHADKITGILSCFDRMIIKGYLPFSYPQSMEGFLFQNHILIKEFPALAKEQSTLLKDNARKLAEQAGRPMIPVPYKIRKEDYARKLAEKDGSELDRAIERLDHFRSIQSQLSATALH